MELLIPTALGILLSALSPLLVSVLTRASMSPKTKSVIAVSVSAVVAIAWLGVTGGLGALTLSAGAPAFIQALGLAVASAYGLQQAVHVFLFKGTDLAENLLTHTGVTDGESDATGSGFTLEDETYVEATDDEELLGA